MPFPWWRFNRLSSLAHRGVFFAPNLKVFRLWRGSWPIAVNLQRELPWHPSTVFVAPLQRREASKKVSLEFSLAARLLLAETLVKFWILLNPKLPHFGLFLFALAAELERPSHLFSGELQSIWKQSSLKVVWAPSQQRAASKKVKDFQTSGQACF